MAAWWRWGPGAPTSPGWSTRPSLTRRPWTAPSWRSSRPSPGIRRSTWPSAPPGVSGTLSPSPTRPTSWDAWGPTTTPGGTWTGSGGLGPPWRPRWAPRWRRRPARKLVEPSAALRRECAREDAKVVLVGGGGGAAAVVPQVEATMGVPYRIVETGAIISTIGVALAMIRETIERSITNPTEEDLL